LRSVSHLLDDNSSGGLETEIRYRICEEGGIMPSIRTLKLGGLVFAFLVFVYVVFSWLGSGDGAQQGAQATPTASMDAGQFDTFGIVENTLTPTVTAIQGYENVTYQSSSSYPEMVIPRQGQVVCYFGNGDIVTFTDEPGGLHITGTKSREDFLAVAQFVQSVDQNQDGWVKLTDAGGISVAYTNGQWQADWLRGCPSAMRTPQP
jgi:hypothetical protein